MIAHFRILPFVLGIVAASLVYMIYKPEKQIIHKYPHPSKASELVFRDKNAACYTYTSHEVNCDAHEETLRDYPIQG
jgi:hypothetical protein